MNLADYINRLTGTEQPLVEVEPPCILTLLLGEKANDND